VKILVAEHDGPTLEFVERGPRAHGRELSGAGDVAAAGLEPPARPAQVR
jgi:hypothetical protein